MPVSHAFVERLIGTVRREFIDHVLFWNALDLERKLQEFRGYYNSSRVHQSLSGSTPAELLANHGQAAPSWVPTGGGSIAEDCSSHRSPLD